MSEAYENTDVTADSIAPDSSTGTETENNTANPVPIENRFAELNRKFTSFQRNIDEKFSQLISSIGAPQAAAPQTQGADKAPIESQLDYTVQTAVSQALIKDKHAQSYKDALKSYPELDKTSDAFDPDFFGLADKYYRALANTSDPDAPVKAIRLAAMDMGKYEKLERERILADETRRMRILGEGTTGPRPGHKNANGGLSKNLQGLAQLLKVDAKQVEDHIKKNSTRYGGAGR